MSSSPPLQEGDNSSEDMIIRPVYSDDSPESANANEVVILPRHETPHRHLSTAQSKLVDVAVSDGLIHIPHLQQPSTFGPVRSHSLTSGIRKNIKERRLFERFIYCLPDVQSFLPSFTSTVERDLNLKREYQYKGYGYPARDYNNGYPRPTQIPVNQSAQEFRAFLGKLYPNLEGRDTQIYRMDRQKRLIKVLSGTPRELKDSNYKGIIIIIPTGNNGQNGPVSSTSCPKDDILQLPSLREEPVQHIPSVKHLKYSLVPQHLQPVGVSAAPVQPVTLTHVKNEPVDHCSPTRTEGPQFQQTEKNKSRKPTKIFHSKHFGDTIKIKALVQSEKSTLGSARTLLVSRETLVDDILRFYREDSSVVEDDVSVFIQNTKTGNTEEADINIVFTEFWRRAYKFCFEGDGEVVPKLSPLQDRDVFHVLGRILAHGLILMNYWPLRLSRPCALMILAGREASEEFLVTSFRSVLSETERGVVEDLESKIKNCEGYDSPANMALASKALAPYGCTQLPPAENLASFLTEIAIQHCQCRPYWPLVQMHTGLTNTSNVSFRDVTETDVNAFYDSLVPSSTSLLSKITYSYSDNDKTVSFEKSVSSFLERVLLKMNKDQLRRLLLLWTGSDCLSSDFLFVTFIDSSQVSPPSFDRAGCEMNLSRFFPSAEVLQDHLESCLEDSISLSSY